jgi:hypothetical protein
VAKASCQATIGKGNRQKFTHSNWHKLVPRLEANLRAWRCRFGDPGALLSSNTLCVWPSSGTWRARCRLGRQGRTNGSMVPDSCVTMSTERSAISERREDVASTTAMQRVRNSWFTPRRTSNEWEQPKANHTALPVGRYVGGPENIQISVLPMHKQQTNENN